jgi:hypothetical protein
MLDIDALDVVWQQPIRGLVHRMQDRWRTLDG